MLRPSISICIAAFKADRFLEATLRTVLSQTFHDWELIVVEDGSRDRTESLVAEFATRVPQRVVYERHPENRGVPAARNTGVAAAAGEWVAFLDADDLWKPAHLETLVSTSQIEDSDAVYGGSIQYDDATWTKLSTRAPSDRDLVDLPLALYTGRLSIMASAVMIKRTALERHGVLSAEYPHCSDIEYWLRVLSNGGRLLYTGANTCIYRRHSGSLSEQKTAALMENARICEQYAKWKAIPRWVARQRTARLYRWAGRSLLPEGRAAALKPLTRSLRLQPFSPKTLGLWARTYFCSDARLPAPGYQS